MRYINVKPKPLIFALIAIAILSAENAEDKSLQNLTERYHTVEQHVGQRGANIWVIFAITISILSFLFDNALDAIGRTKTALGIDIKGWFKSD